MYLTVTQKLKHLSKEDYTNLRELCRIAKNLTNEAMYSIRQYYFTEDEYLNYEKNYVLLKNSPNYKLLNSHMAQQILKEVDGSFKSFFRLLKLARCGKYNYRGCKLPNYLPKDGFATLIVSVVRLHGNKFIIPYSKLFKQTHSSVEITVPPLLINKDVREIRIIPKSGARFFEIQYAYKAEYCQRNLNKNNALAIDLGVDNLVTAVSNSGGSFILDGRKLKSINQWFNKEYARLCGIKDRQFFGTGTTARQNRLADIRNRKVNDYISKCAKLIVSYCIKNDIGILVIGYNETFQRSPSMGTRINQNFVNIPYGKLRLKLEYLCELNGITFVKQEESYTSKASFWDRDIIPVYNADNPQAYEFSGTRISRGLYRTAGGKLLNADVNGALNILRKSNVVSLEALYSRGEADTPIRIRIA